MTPRWGAMICLRIASLPSITCCFSPSKGPNVAIAEYRQTIETPAPPTLAQLPGRVGVMTAYPIAERYQDFLEEWVGRGARDFVWLSYFPTPGDRQKVSPYDALYATYDLYLDYFAEGPRKATDWAADKVQYRANGKRSSRLLELHVVVARVVRGRSDDARHGSIRPRIQR